ncbi:hypothetical protein ACTA71_011833 [Dictyostelium dimigraforme]
MPKLNNLVNYNIPTAYDISKEEGCGINNEPICTSLKDALNRAILLSNNFSIVCIGIIGNIDIAEQQITVGNSYNFCGTLWINSENINADNNKTIINGVSSLTQPFLTLQEPDEENQIKLCSRTIAFKNINFTNWYQPILSVNINQYELVTSIKNTFAFTMCNIISSGNIIFIYPKNYGRLFYFNSLSVLFTSTPVFNLKPSTILAPNSSTDYIAPFHIVGCDVGIELKVFDAVFESTPLLFLEGGSFTLYGLSNVSNSQSIFQTTYYAHSPSFPIIQTIRERDFEPVTFTNNTNLLNYETRTYLGYQLENWLMVIRQQQ